MKCLLLFVSVALLVASSSAILNGDVSPHLPYYARISFTVAGQVGVQNKAGVIISDRFVLTTGIFFGNAQNPAVWVGSNVRQSQLSHLAVGPIAISTLVDGPALMRIVEPLVFSQTVSSIRMASVETRTGMTFEQGMVPGMGGSPTSTHNSLYSAHMRIVPTALCQTNYPTRDMNSFFCAYDSARSDFCGEDRGTAFTTLVRGEEFLIGIAIEGVCSQSAHDRPSLFANIISYRTRINDIINGLQGTL